MQFKSPVFFGFGIMPSTLIGIAFDFPLPYTARFFRDRVDEYRQIRIAIIVGIKPLPMLFFRKRFLECCKRTLQGNIDAKAQIKITALIAGRFFFKFKHDFRIFPQRSFENNAFAGNGHTGGNREQCAKNNDIVKECFHGRDVPLIKRSK